MTRTMAAMRRLSDSAEMAEVVLELVQRWKRAQTRGSTFDAGRSEGYVQAIQLMLGLSHAETVDMLHKGTIIISG
jgi:hypothetical protein